MKLVAVDMDGTLLNEKKEMPERIFGIIDKLHQRNITFAIASGRQHLSLQKLYDKIKDEIVFIAGNGSIIIDKGEILFADNLNGDVVREIVSKIKEIPKVHIILCGLESAYFLTDGLFEVMPQYLMDSHFPVKKIIYDLDELPFGEEIIQIAVYDEEANSKTNVYDKIKGFENVAHITISENTWVDIMNRGVNKGVAINKLQQILKATPKDTMVFGDALNDLEMMQQAYYSYAMENAVAEIKESANFSAPSNEDEGVIQILDEFLNNDEQ